MDRRLLIFSVGILAGSFQGARASDMPALDSPGCMEEVQQVCQGSQDIAVCLATQGARISDACREQYFEAQGMMHDSEGPGACATDLQSLCPATSVRAIQKCLRRQIQNLPASCRTVLAALPPM